MKLSGNNANNVSNLTELARLFSILVGELKTILNGGLFFSDNFNAKTVTVSFTAANSDTRIEHNLGRVPSGYLVTSLSAATIIYSGAQSTTEQYIFLRSSAAPATVNLVIF